MADLLAEFKSKAPLVKHGETVIGVITSIEPSRVVVDIGGKSEGLVAEKAYTYAKDYIKHLKVGDRVTAQILVTETPEGYIILSLKKSAQDYFWKILEESYRKGEDVDVIGKVVNPAGVVVDIYGLSGFVPTSHISKKNFKSTQSLLEKSFKAKIIELDRENRRIILSEKFVSEASEIEAQNKALSYLKAGEVYDGIVTSATDFGCFVKIMLPVKGKKEKVEVEGLVHVSEMSWEKVDKAVDYVSEGDNVKVKVLEVTGSKLSLSIKQSESDPWDKFVEKYKVDTRIKGEVSKVTDFGVFVILEPGIEGLLHMTKIPPGRNLSKGDKVEVNIEEIDEKTKKISLGLVLTEKPIGYK